MHLGIIPDGHRRYAQNNGITRQRSYLQSQHRINDIISKLDRNDEEDIDQDIEEVTIYGMSEENLKRSDEELEIFYDALREYFLQLLSVAEEYREVDLQKYSSYSSVMNSEFVYHGVNQILSRSEAFFQSEQVSSLSPLDIDFQFVSTRMSAAPDDIQEMVNDIERVYDGSVRVNVLFMYSGKREITQAATKISNNEKRITTDEFLDHLKLQCPIDLVIRTGDNPSRECLSGFALFQSAYSEYVHVPKNFPAVDIADIKAGLDQYSKLRRKRGK